MSTFICNKCGCIDNTSCGGNYYTKLYGKSEPSEKFYKEEFANILDLCSECTPSTYIDGSKTTGEGKWHDSFEKEFWTESGDKIAILKKCDMDKGDFINAHEFFNYLDKLTKIIQLKDDENDIVDMRTKLFIGAMLIDTPISLMISDKIDNCRYVSFIDGHNTSFKVDITGVIDVRTDTIQNISGGLYVVKNDIELR